MKNDMPPLEVEAAPNLIRELAAALIFLLLIILFESDFTRNLIYFNNLSTREGDHICLSLFLNLEFAGFLNDELLEQDI